MYLNIFFIILIIMKIRFCPYCNSQINLDKTYEHDVCEEFTQFVLDEMIAKAREKLEILLLKRKELTINKQYLSKIL